MRKINILVTGGGSPGIMGTIYSLRENYDKREVRIICTDAKETCVGKFVADKYYQIPLVLREDEYLVAIKKICMNERIDVILPQNTKELDLLSRVKNEFINLGTAIVISDESAQIIANNKYELLKICEKIQVPFPEYHLVSTRSQLEVAAYKLGWPEKPFVVKPPNSNGSRGLRIIDENKNYKDLFFNDKPTNLFVQLEYFKTMLGNEFPELLVMEYLGGDEITVDIYRDTEKFIAIPRIREEIRSGISFQNRAEKREDIIMYSKKLSEYLDLRFCFGFQFKYDQKGVPKILECNPRVQGTMIFSTLMGANLIYSAIKSCLGEEIPEFDFNWSTRLYRYWGAIATNQKDGILKI